MKKALLTTLLLLAGLAAVAQTPRLLDADFQMNGPMTIYWDTDNPADMTNADVGCKWHLEQKKSGDTRTVTFWIDMADYRLKQLSKTTWKDAVVVLTENGDEKLKMYVVRDYQFRHLTIAEYERGKYLVQLCSIFEQ